MKKRYFVDAEELVKQHTENYSRGYKIPTITEQEIVKPYLEEIKAEIREHAYPIVHSTNSHELGMTLYGIEQVIDRKIREVQK